MNLFQFLRDWSEVWALLIPLTIIVIYKPVTGNVRFLVFYVIAAFIFNFLAILMVEYYYLVPDALMSNGNNIFYNLHSFVMVVFFSWYIINIKLHQYVVLLKVLLVVYLVFVAINFIFWKNPAMLSTSHFTAGSIVLLLMCFFYFFSSMQDESHTNWLRHPSFIICVGICLYQAITFFIFLFIYPMYDHDYNQNLSFAMFMMRLYQVIFVVFCIMLAMGLYQYRSVGKKQAKFNKISS